MVEEPVQTIWFPLNLKFYMHKNKDYILIYTNKVTTNFPLSK